MAYSFHERLERESPLEWWFVHGRLEGHPLGERYFMVSLFRSRLSAARGQPFEACSALISVLDPVTGGQRTSSRVDRRLLTALRDAETARALDPHSPAAVLDELRAFGLLREFESPAVDPVFCQEPFSCRWEDLAISIGQGSCTLAFREPKGSLEYDLELHPEVPRLVVESAELVGRPEQAMRYVTYPQLRLQGSAGGSPVHGTAWFDHQWGGRAWLESQDSPLRPQGWDWLGFHLKDGGSWIALRHWDVRSGAESTRYLTMREASGAVRVTRAFEWKPTRWWSSPSTRTSYPVEWRLQAREFDADVTFKPLADHQEICVFSPMRAIWEGAGIVRGRARGQAVEANARLEGQGYGYILSPSDYLNRWTCHVDRVVSHFLPPGSREGQRWLAILTSLLLEALGQDSESFRQGRLNGKQKLAIWSAYLRQIIGAHLLPNHDEFRAGQLDRPTLDRWMQDSLGPRIRASYLGKTTTPAEKLVEATAAIARLDGERQRAIRSLASSLGLALQFGADAIRFSADLASGKLNYVIYRSLQLLPPASGERVRDLLCDRRLRGDAEVLAEGIALVASSGACESVHAEARDVFRHAWRDFSRYAGPSIAKTELRLLVESLVEQTYAGNAPLRF